jgi:glycerol-3-phosphate dehydrogenase
MIEAEVLWAARHELALSVDDVLSRRTRLVQELPDRGAAVAPRVAEILGAELGWDAERQAREVGTFLELARREFAVA